MQKQDILLHHPFESFAPVINLLREAARDPQVLAISKPCTVVVQILKLYKFSRSG
jgi:polyphosphate kinase